jgi:hypothetical protein
MEIMPYWMGELRPVNRNNTLFEWVSWENYFPVNANNAMLNGWVQKIISWLMRIMSY